MHLWHHILLLPWKVPLVLLQLPRRCLVAVQNKLVTTSTSLVSKGVIGRVHDPRPGRRKQPGPSYPGSYRAVRSCLLACFISCKLASALDWLLAWIAYFRLPETQRGSVGPPAGTSVRSAEPGSPGTQEICVSTQPGHGASFARVGPG
jgi:hypothetical protein